MTLAEAAGDSSSRRERRRAGAAGAAGGAAAAMGSAVSGAPLVISVVANFGMRRRALCASNWWPKRSRQPRTPRPRSLFLHGWGTGARVWGAQLPEFVTDHRGRYRLLAIAGDRRRHYRAGSAHRPGAAEFNAALRAALADQARAQSFVKVPVNCVNEPSFIAMKVVTLPAPKSSTSTIRACRSSKVYKSDGENFHLRPQVNQANQT